MSKFEVKVTQEDIDESMLQGFNRIEERGHGFRCPISVALRRNGLSCYITHNGDITTNDENECYGDILARCITGDARKMLSCYIFGTCRLSPTTLTYETVY
jgi:hypothetical protein